MEETKKEGPRVTNIRINSMDTHCLNLVKWFAHRFKFSHGAVQLLSRLGII